MYSCKNIFKNQYTFINLLIPPSQSVSVWFPQQDFRNDLPVLMKEGRHKRSPWLNGSSAALGKVSLFAGCVHWWHVSRVTLLQSPDHNALKCEQVAVLSSYPWDHGCPTWSGQFGLYVMINVQLVSLTCSFKLLYKLVGSISSRS